MFEISRRYRTIHSIKDDELEIVLDNLPDPLAVALDHGCHLGHLSFELAARCDCTIYAVDNFSGTIGDDLMRDTVDTLTGGTMDFMPLFLENMREAERLFGGFRGEIRPVRAGVFMREILPTLDLDFAFIDSSHREEDAYEFDEIAARIRPGGVLAGHDYSSSCPGVWNAIPRIIGGFEWRHEAYTWALQKRTPTTPSSVRVRA